jgi:hypothetical protein
MQAMGKALRFSLLLVFLAPVLWAQEKPDDFARNFEQPVEKVYVATV